MLGRNRITPGSTSGTGLVGTTGGDGSSQGAPGTADDLNNSNDGGSSGGGGSSPGRARQRAREKANNDNSSSGSGNPHNSVAPDPRKFHDNKAKDTDNDGQANTVETTTHTTMSNPFNSGKTGSEIIAEGGSPASAITIDSDAHSMKDVIKDKGVKGTLGTISDLAQDGNDSNSSPTFDAVPNTQEGKDALKDTVGSVVDTAKDMTPGQNTNQTTGNNPVNQAQKAVSGFGGKSTTALLVAVAAIAGILGFVGGN
jgi:hypothetical protein